MWMDYDDNSLSTIDSPYAFGIKPFWVFSHGLEAESSWLPVERARRKQRGETELPVSSS